MVAVLYAREGGDFRLPKPKDQSPATRKPNYWTLHLLLRTCSDPEFVNPIDGDSRFSWLQFGQILRGVVQNLIGDRPGLLLHDWEVPEPIYPSKNQWIIDSKKARSGCFIRMNSSAFVNHAWPSPGWFSGQAAFGDRAVGGFIDTALVDLEDGSYVAAREKWLAAMLEPRLREEIFRTTDAVIGAYYMDWPESADPWYAFSRRIPMDAALFRIERILSDAGFRTQRTAEIGTLYGLF